MFQLALLALGQSSCALMTTTELAMRCTTQRANPHPAQPHGAACSYNRILAPTLRVFEDRRINLRQVDLDFDLS